MDIEEIQRHLEQALQELIAKDSHLLINNLSEQSMTHRLALHLTPKFSVYDVDCEYNGDVDSDVKRKEIDVLTVNAERLEIIRNASPRDENTIVKRVFPDIIIHKRGRNNHNLLVIEAKKSTNNDTKALEYDFEKLRIFTSQDDTNSFNYTLGAFVEFIVGTNPNYMIRWFANGREQAGDVHDG